jgi:hypothetical protein
VPSFVVAQVVGGAAAILLIRALYPDITPEEAAEVAMPHDGRADAPDRPLASTPPR